MGRTGTPCDITASPYAAKRPSPSRRMPTPQHAGMFPMVSDLVESRRLSADVPLGALLASLPDVPTGRLNRTFPSCTLAFPHGESFDSTLGRQPADSVGLFVLDSQDEIWLRTTYPALRGAEVAIAGRANALQSAGQRTIPVSVEPFVKSSNRVDGREPASCPSRISITFDPPFPTSRLHYLRRL